MSNWLNPVHQPTAEEYHAMADAQQQGELYSISDPPEVTLHDLNGKYAGHWVRLERPNYTSIPDIEGLCEKFYFRNDDQLVVRLSNGKATVVEANVMPNDAIDIPAEADPELGRLLAEEEEIEQRAQATQAANELSKLKNTLQIAESNITRITHELAQAEEVRDSYIREARTVQQTLDRLMGDLVILSTKLEDTPLAMLRYILRGMGHS